MLMDRLTVKVYNDKYFKVSVCHADRDGLPGFGGNDRQNEKRELGEDEVIENLKRSARRAYQNLMACAKGLGVDRMLTLTFAKNVTVESKDVAMKCFQRFTRLCREAFGVFDYVATLETQKRGAIHFHLGVVGYYNVWRLWELWKKAIRQSGLVEACDKVGSVFINRKWQQTKGGLVAYIAKYILKESYKFIQNGVKLREKYGKRYLASHVNVEKTSILIPKAWYSDFALSIHLNELFSERKLAIKEISKLKTVKTFVLGMDWSFCDGFLYGYSVII
jgi:hypothetical protein